MGIPVLVIILVMDIVVAVVTKLVTDIPVLVIINNIRDGVCVMVARMLVVVIVMLDVITRLFLKVILCMLYV